MKFNFRNPISLIFSMIWNFSEDFNIPLGRFAPYVFGKAIGAKKIKKK